MSENATPRVQVAPPGEITRTKEVIDKNGDVIRVEVIEPKPKQ